MLILPHAVAADEFLKLNVVLLSDPGDTSNNLTLIKLKAKNCLHVEFNDINKIVEGYTAPSIEHISRILDFAKINEVGLVSCAAGISRSSAVAYLIKCLTEEPRNAIMVLDKEYHQPNKRIIKIGAKLLNNPEVTKEYEYFIRHTS